MPTTKSVPIAVFDSGVGRLSVLRAIRDQFLTPTPFLNNQQSKILHPVRVHPWLQFLIPNS